MKTLRNAEKAVAEETEKDIDENNISEVQDFIKRLGFQQNFPNGAERKLKKDKIKKKVKTTNPENAAALPKQPKVIKSKNVAKCLPAASDRSTEAVNFDQPPQNKKIVFDSSYLKESDKIVEKKKGRLEKQPQIQQTPLNLDQPPQNKKIVFDESYLKKTEKPTWANKVKTQDATQVGEKSDKSVPWYNLLIKPDVVWYQQGKPLKSNSTESATPAEIAAYEEEAKKLLDEDSFSFKKVRDVGSDRSESKWMQTVLKSGAFSDKIAVHTILLQESVPHNLASLRFLISLIDVKGRRECLASLDALLRMFTEGKILNPSSKLVLFSKQPFSQLSKTNKRERQETLALWLFEHQLKDLYNQFVLALDGLLKDAVETTRRKGVAAVSMLLAYSPEQEQSLLSRLVNKVGDPTRVVATSAVSQLERLLQSHGNMKLVVVSEIERLLYRSNINTKAQYYALCFLSQILLDPEDIQLATKLIIIYVSFFKACVKKGEVDSKLMSALLTGVKRAFPYTQSGTVEGGPLDGHVDTLFKLVHLVRFTLGVQVLCILDQVAGNVQVNSDRFYSVLFRKLLDPELIQSNKQNMFLNLLYRALKRDDSIARLRAFVKRILQVCLASPPQLACGLLYLTSELFKNRPELLIFPKETKKYIEEEDDEDDEEHYEDIAGDETAETVETVVTEEQKEESGKEKPQSSTWVHRNNFHQKQSHGRGYDSMARNPMYARADECGGYWELALLMNHYHPSVTTFAKTAMEGLTIEYSGDPLQDFTLVRFLDRFVFRNPKQIPSKLEQGTGQRRVLGKRSLYQPKGIRSMAVDSKEFLKQPAESIPADELYLYQYFLSRKSTKGKFKPGDEKDDDIESVGSEDFNDYLAEIDFAKDMNKPKKAVKSKKSDKEDDDEDDDAGSESDLDAAEGDSEEDFDEDEEFQDAFKDFDEMLNDKTIPKIGEDGNISEEDGEDEEDETGEFNEEDIEFSDDDDLEAAPAQMTAAAAAKSKSKKRPVKDDIDDFDWAFQDMPLSKKKRTQDLFANPESAFIDAEEFGKLLEKNTHKSTGTSEEVSNKDKATPKQLEWEMKRDQWMNDRNRPRNDKKKGRGGKAGKGKAGKAGPAFRRKRSAKK